MLQNGVRKERKEKEKEKEKVKYSGEDSVITQGYACFVVYSLIVVTAGNNGDSPCDRCGGAWY